MDQQDVVQGMSMKLWWIFRTKRSLWAKFMNSRYLKNIIHPNYVSDIRNSSSVWKMMIAMKDLVEPQIDMRIRKGSSSLWFDNWSEDGLPAMEKAPWYDLKLNQV
ncbi:hypothetical protein ACH5RR_036994 [Cinchona calisaya]|uniref:Uncharacterized protein n=1 Tax=Cinchona calisaya TaxID=153742 RepID=A0ABD2Y8M9_9GENT